MSRGIKRDTRNIYPYTLSDGTTKYQIRLRVHGKRISATRPTLDEAISKRDELLGRRSKDQERMQRGEQPTFTPEPKQRGGRAPQRTVALFLRDEFLLPVIDAAEKNTGPTRGRARGRGGAKQLPFAPKTLRTAKSALKRLIWDTELAALDPSRVDAQDISEWITECRERGNSNADIRQALKLLSNAFGWAATMPRQTGIGANPVLSASWPPEISGKEPQYFDFQTTEWIRQWILHASPGRTEQRRRRNALLFSLMQGSALRPEEARQIEVDHIDEDNCCLIVPARISKTHQQRIVPLWRPTLEEILAYIADYGLRPSDPLIGQLDGKAMSASSWERWRDDVFYPARIWTAALVDDKRLETAVAYDVCRHRWAKAQLAALMPPRDVAEAMGHDLTTLDRVYAGPIREGQRRRADNIPYEPELELERAREHVAARIEETIATTRPAKELLAEWKASQPPRRRP